MLSNKLLEELSQSFNRIPFNNLLGLTLDEMQDKQVTMHFSMKKELVGNYMYGILHGGVISSVLDMAGGVVVMAAAVQKHADKNPQEIAAILGKSSTINLHVDYIRPGKGEYFQAKAFLIQAGNKVSFTRMELYNHESILIATGTGTYLVG